ncbi:hypothetical protein EDC01DRAFT_634537 [Geopyxis carbonaria]|nr:hypothetical protein EDC01DRAFT_634537 [Geopyxis carbonaria]
MATRDGDISGEMNNMSIGRTTNTTTASSFIPTPLVFAPGPAPPPAPSPPPSPSCSSICPSSPPFTPRSSTLSSRCSSPYTRPPSPPARFPAHFIHPANKRRGQRPFSRSRNFFAPSTTIFKAKPPRRRPHMPVGAFGDTHSRWPNACMPLPALENQFTFATPAALRAFDEYLRAHSLGFSDPDWSIRELHPPWFGHFEELNPVLDNEGREVGWRIQTVDRFPGGVETRGMWMADWEDGLEIEDWSVERGVFSFGDRLQEGRGTVQGKYLRKRNEQPRDTCSNTRHASRNCRAIKW